MDGNLTESPLLIAQNGPLKGQRWTINKPLLVGRETTCEIVVVDRMVSRFHATNNTNHRWDAVGGLG